MCIRTYFFRQLVLITHSYYSFRQSFCALILSTRLANSFRPRIHISYSVPRSVHSLRLIHTMQSFRPLFKSIIQIFNQTIILSPHSVHLFCILFLFTHSGTHSAHSFISLIQTTHSDHSFRPIIHVTHSDHSFCSFINQTIHSDHSFWPLIF